MTRRSTERPLLGQITTTVAVADDTLIHGCTDRAVNGDSSR